MPTVLERVKEDKLDLLNDLIQKEVKTKYCNKCNCSKFLNEFYKDISKTDLLHSTCKICHKIAIKNKSNLNSSINNQIIVMPSYLKQCNKCKIKKNSYQFRVNRRTHDGFTSLCKKCLCKYEKNNPRKDRSKFDNKRQNLRYVFKSNGILDLFIKESGEKCLYCKRKKSRLFTLVYS